MALLPAAIGAFTFIRAEGPVYLPSMQLEDLQRPGVDGFAVKELGVRGEPFDWSTEAGATTDQDLADLRAAYYASRGTVVTIREAGWSLEIDNVLVRSVRCGHRRPISNATDGFVWILPATWSLVVLTPTA